MRHVQTGTNVMKKDRAFNVTGKSESLKSVIAPENTAVYQYANAGHATLV